jgi:2-keto-4-pentenoate hydratase/2-oxohepta-3-ene-1,7-dioic acid hydratase in catechol pathway
MKLARYRLKNEECYGILEQQRVVCLPALAKRLREVMPPRIEDFIASENALATAETLLGKAKPSDLKAVSAPLNAMSLQAPLAFPPKIICLGWNYIDHAAETKVTLPDEPVIFMKPHTAIIGTGESIIKRPFVKELDYEGELAIVMGKKAKDVPVAEAADCIFGYTIFNDVSARDYQFKDKQWTRGKSFDTFAPTGPCITTRNQLSDTGNLSIRTWVNGELRQDGSTRDMVFNVPQIIYHLSRVITLEPSDIIATGTPSGVGMAMKPPKWLKNGDVVRIEIEGIGFLENSVEEK